MSNLEPANAAMSEAKPETIDPATLTLNLEGVEGVLCWPELFGNGHPVELEVGSGKGLFLQNAATARPGHNFIGVELAKKYAGKAAQRVAKYRLRNVRVWPGDALRFIARHVADKSLDAVHVYFPDPWWKARHKKRRVFREALVDDIARTLRDGGDLWVATDVEEYYGVILALIASRPIFRQVDWDLEAAVEVEGDPNYLTNFERKYRIEGRPIYRARYRKTEVPGENAV